MENNKIKRFYIMPEVWVTVTQSQVFNWIKLISDKNISTDCISITTKKNTDSTVKKIEKSINGKFIEIHDPRRLIVNDIYMTCVLLKFYFKNVFKYKKIIFQTRLGTIGYTYAFLSWLPKAKFIFEGRGAGNEERIHTNSDQKESLKVKIKNFFSETSEKLTLSKSNKVICVSHALKKYYMNKFNLAEKKFHVFPGAADSDLFFYDEKLRSDTRKELNLGSDDIVMVYSGRLEMKWEIPDKIFDFFKDLYARNNKFKLLLITPDVDIANELINDYGVSQISFVRKVNLEGVNGLLNASDVGLLLREDVVMNNVASPTKFAEYMMSGLPVLISKGIHDFAQSIDNTGYGVSVTGLDTILEQEYKKLIASLDVDKVEIAEWSLNNLSKKMFINEYVSLLQTA